MFAHSWRRPGSGCASGGLDPANGSGQQFAHADNATRSREIDCLDGCEPDQVSGGRGLVFGRAHRDGDDAAMWGRARGGPVVVLEVTTEALSLA